MRDGKLERLGETRKRSEDEEEGEARKVKQRRSGVEALDLLKEKKPKDIKEGKGAGNEGQKIGTCIFHLTCCFFFQLA